MGQKTEQGRGGDLSSFASFLELQNWKGVFGTGQRDSLPPPCVWLLLLFGEPPGVGQMV